MSLPSQFSFCNLSKLYKILIQQAVEKVRCILPLPNLFPRLARRFPFHFAPFGLTALRALRSVLLKNRRLVKVNLEVSSQLEFSLKINCGLTACEESKLKNKVKIVKEEDKATWV